MIELGTFLTPLAGPDPRGIELRNDPRFHAIERLLEPAARSVRAEAVQRGGSGAVQIDWAGVVDQAADLAGEGRDLRLLVIVTRALAGTDGFAGLADGLTMLSGTLAQHWDNLHPALRESPSPREAATRRVNALYQLENADNGLLCDLEFAPVLTVRMIGAVSGGDLAAATLSTQAALAQAPGLAERERAALVEAHEARVNRVRGATRAQAAEQPEAFAALVDAVERARAALTALEAAADARIAENGVGLKFDKLGPFLARVGQTLAQAGAHAAPAAAAPALEVAMNATAAAATPAAGGGAAAAGGGIPGRVNSRGDVERCLDMIIDFYERTEPSSPIPHLARRMRKMVPMTFVQLMEEIAPSGLKEFRNVAGVTEEKPR